MFLKIAALLVASTISIYPNSGKIQSVDIEKDTFTIEDAAGNLWKMEGIDDWQVGDRCAMIMDTNGTEYTINDDIIVSVKYME